MRGSRRRSGCKSGNPGGPSLQVNLSAPGGDVEGQLQAELWTTRRALVRFVEGQLAPGGDVNWGSARSREEGTGSRRSGESGSPGGAVWF